MISRAELLIYIVLRKYQSFYYDTFNSWCAKQKKLHFSSWIL